MFIANTLREKIESSPFELEKKPSQCAFPYSKKPNPPELLLAPKILEETISIESLTMKERNKKFTISKLREKWNGKLNVNFEKKFKKFSSDCMNNRAKSAKIFGKDLVCHNVLTKPKPRWNIGTKLNEKREDIPLETKLFNITQGLDSYPVEQVKDHQVKEDVDCKYERKSANETRWNKTTKLEEFEKDQIQTEILKKAMNNTQHYWNKTIYSRLHEDKYSITEERKKVEEPRHYKKYRDPLTLTQYNYDKMNEVKKRLWIETEIKTEKIKHENPGCEKLEEKINSIVQREMSNVYQIQFNLLTGKKKIKTCDSRNYVWKDKEIIDKIYTINNWDNLSWFNPSQRPLSQYANNIEIKKKEILKPLITKNFDILQEEKILKEQMKNDLKKEKKNKLLQQRTNEVVSNEMREHLKQSKYPICEKEYQNLIKTQETKQDDKEIQNEEKAVYEQQKNNEEFFEQKNHYFFEAYKKILIDANKKAKQNKREKKQYRYFHLGTFVSSIINIFQREFVFEEKEFGQKETKMEKYKAWSCCMNTLEHSRGCHKQQINLRQWNLDHF